MAIQANQDQKYYIIAKHSGLALTVDNFNMGVTVKQQKLDPKNVHQRFRLFPLNYYYVIGMAEIKDRSLAVHAGWQTNGAPIIDWSWNPGEANQTFEFVPAADGYYHIMARHSRKVFDIEEVSVAEGKRLTQHEVHDGANQLFKLVQVTDAGLKDNPTSFAKANEDMRNGIIAVVGKIPEYGGAIAFVIGFFWKPVDQLADLWDQMKSYVDVRIREFLDQERLRTIKIQMTAHMKNLKEIHDRIEEGTQPQGVALQALMQKLIETQEQNWAITADRDDKAVEKTKGVLPYVLGLGTIILSIRQMMATAIGYRKLYHTEPTATVLELNKGFLLAAANEYTKWIDGAKAELLAWRMSFIPININSEHFEPLPVHHDSELHKVAEEGEIVATDEELEKLEVSAKPVGFARDKYTGWLLEWEELKFADYRARARHAIDNRRNQVDIQFRAAINEMTAPAKYWKYFAPGVAGYEPKEALQEVGTYGGYHATTGFSGPDGKNITKVTFHAWANGALCGLELFYDTVSNGLQGREGNEKRTFEMRAGEYIATVYGLELDVIEGLWFGTNQGRVEGGGSIHRREGTQFFFADIHDNLNAKLVKVRGAHNGNHIQQLAFQWKYVD